MVLRMMTIMAMKVDKITRVARQQKMRATEVVSSTTRASITGMTRARSTQTQTQERTSSTRTCVGAYSALKSKEMPMISSMISSSRSHRRRPLTRTKSNIPCSITNLTLSREKRRISSARLVWANLPNLWLRKNLSRPRGSRSLRKWWVMFSSNREPQLGWARFSNRYSWYSSISRTAISSRTPMRARASGGQSPMKRNWCQVLTVSPLAKRSLCHLNYNKAFRGRISNSLPSRSISSQTILWRYLGATGPLNG